jgi:hypothetical protein
VPKPSVPQTGHRPLPATGPPVDLPHPSSAPPSPPASDPRPAPAHPEAEASSRSPGAADSKLRSYASALRARAPALVSLWRALLAKNAQSFRDLATAYTASIDVACAAAFLETRRAVAPSADQTHSLAARATAEAARAKARDVACIFSDAGPELRPGYRPRLVRFLQSLASTLGTTEEPASAPTLSPEALPRDTAALQSFAHASHMFVASLHAGWPLAEALALWPPVQLGSFSKNGKTFYPGPRTPQQSFPDWSQYEVRTFPRAPGEAPITIHIQGGTIRAITSSSSLRVAQATTSGTPRHLADLPAFIALPRDEAGRPIIPKSRVTALVEAQDAWQCELGPLDRLTSIIVRGQLVMPKITTPSQCTALRNHPFWEDDPVAQAALGPIIAKWLAQGVLEYQRRTFSFIAWDSTMFYRYSESLCSGH